MIGLRPGDRFILQSTMMNTASQKHTALETKLNQPIPRNARYTRSTQMGRAFGVLSSICALWVAVYAASNDHDEWNRLRRSGNLVNATIVDKQVHHGKSTTHWLYYHYDEGSSSLDGSEKVSESEYVSAPIGAYVPITVLPNDLSVYREGPVTQDRVDDNYKRWAWGISFGAGILILVGAGCEYEFRKHFNLLRSGQVAQARVADKQITNTGKSIMYSITYEFTAGRTSAKNTVYLSHDDFNSMEIGDGITILYDTENTVNSLPYKMIQHASIEECD